MTLGDLSNLALVQLQQPGASFSVGGGGGPSWSTLTNPQFSQGLVEFCINQAYIKLMGDLEDLELTLVAFSLTSTTQTYKYAIPPNGYAPISHVCRVQYQPIGLPYTWEYMPGQQLISWEQFNNDYIGQGYLLSFSFGTQPRVATIDPTLQNVYFYPGSGQSGDTITVSYQPLPALNATGCPTLVAQTDAPIMPIDTHMAIFYYAMWLLWIRAREQAQAQSMSEMYMAELAMIRQKYTRKFMGDNIRIIPFMDQIGLNRY